jgi:hypothetical protein
MEVAAVPRPVARIDRRGNQPAGQLMDLPAVTHLQEPEEQVDRPGLAAPGLRRGVPLVLAEEPVGVGRLHLPRPHASGLQEPIHGRGLTPDGAVRDPVRQPGQHVLRQQVPLVRLGLRRISNRPGRPQIAHDTQHHCPPAASAITKGDRNAD